MKKFALYGIAIILVLSLIVACNARRSVQQTPSTSDSAIEYTVRRGDVTDTISVFGQVVAENFAEVMTLVSGVVKKVNVQEGDTVKAGDVLVELDDTDYRLAYVKALQNYETAKNSGSKLLAEQRQLELEIANRDLERCKITSPIDGTVITLNAKVGDYVRSFSDIIAKVTDLSSLYVSAAIEEIDYPQVRVGQTAVITLDAFEGLKLPGSVTYIGNEAQTVSGIVNVPIKVRFASQGLQDDIRTTRQLKNSIKIIPGLSCEVEIIVSSKTDAIIVPNAAITFEGKKAYVIVKNGETTEKREITVGERTSSGYEIIDGLEEGEVLVISRNSNTTTNTQNKPLMKMPGVTPFR